MFPGLLVKLRPTTPWRITPEGGGRERVDSIYHSDNLFSAVTLAMDRLGRREEWLAATATGEAPAVRFSSCYPFLADTMLVVPPRSLWPPPPSSRVRWKGARFVPLSIVESLVRDADSRVREEEGWVVDAESECLLPPGKFGKPQPPFRIGLRRSVAVDRLSGVTADPLTTACLEFAQGAGLWFLTAFSSAEARDRWNAPLRSALRLLADSGFGAERSRGWGRAAEPEFKEGDFPGLLMNAPAIEPPEAQVQDGSSTEAPETAYWLLSLFSPSSADAVDWTRGFYSLVERNGRTESLSQPGTLKRALRMIGEGSVLLSSGPLQGAAPDVAPEGFPHPVYRSGFALAIPIAWRVIA
ncbi:MAG TPA: hypothetical protein VM120_13165 [Bryobacteraceae bacterium]|nr:hypothetical protein [Bryobacteraceae bacterium]